MARSGMAKKRYGQEAVWPRSGMAKKRYGQEAVWQEVVDRRSATARKREISAPPRSHLRATEVASRRHRGRISTQVREISAPPRSHLGAFEGRGGVRRTRDASHVQSSRVSAFGWTGLGWARLDWNGLGWTGLGWAGPDWTGLDWAGLDWAGLDWAGLRSTPLRQRMGNTPTSARCKRERSVPRPRVLRSSRCRVSGSVPASCCTASDGR